MIAARLRGERAALLADPGLRARGFGAALADSFDAALRAALAEAGDVEGVALVALGSYGRRELSPGSDVDVTLLRSDRGGPGADAFRDLAERLWYPLWDAGLVTGHGARSVKETLALADSNLEALTALLEVRLIAGDVSLAAEVERRVRDLAQKRSTRLLRSLADASAVRRERPGPIAEMLEPDLKDGAGGLRDAQALHWAGWAFGGAGGTAALVARGTLTAADLERVDAARELLLEVRLALQRGTGTRSDRLALQEQDPVAAALGYPDADALVRELASAAREVAWITADVWARVRDALGGPIGRVGRTDVEVAEGVLVRDRRVHIRAGVGGRVPTLRLLEAAAEAADRDMPFDRASLALLGDAAAPAWDVWERAAFLRLLRAGAKAVPVFEALDHEGVLVRLLPEWERVRSLPQRNAYHRFTVDRHLLEAVAECAELLDAGDAAAWSPDDRPTAVEYGSSAAFDALVARSCRRPELLLLGALLHDVAKGLPGDHSEVGAETAGNVTRRLGLDSEGREIVAWLVRNHLLMAEVATRRDLADDSVADHLAAECAGDAERLRLLYLLTIGDSRATGPAAWGPSKAALVRDLFVKTAAAIDRGAARALASDRRVELEARLGAGRAAAFLDRLPDAYPLAFDVERMLVHEELLHHREAVRCETRDGQVSATVVAPDRTGLLTTLAGAFTVCRLDVVEANLFGTSDGLALDTFRALDPFGRLAGDPDLLERTIRAALAGELDLGSRVAARRRGYEQPDDVPGPIEVELRHDVSATDTVVEVHADDDLGLLYRLAATFAELGIDVRVAKVATLGGRVVDVFYVRGANGEKLTGEAELVSLRAALAASVARPPAESAG